MARLRAPDGCPWDREQTHASLRKYLLEETYETLEALDAGDVAALEEELGDLLLQIVFHAQVADEAGEFDLGDVVAGIVAKLIRRHPHVFGDEATGGGVGGRTRRRCCATGRPSSGRSGPRRGRRGVGGTGEGNEGGGALDAGRGTAGDAGPGLRPGGAGAGGAGGLRLAGRGGGGGEGGGGGAGAGGGPPRGPQGAAGGAGRSAVRRRSTCPGTWGSTPRRPCGGPTPSSAPASRRWRAPPGGRGRGWRSTTPPAWTRCGRGPRRRERAG